MQQLNNAVLSPFVMINGFFIKVTIQGYNSMNDKLNDIIMTLSTAFTS